jgi:hypothetical protein
MIGSDLTLQLIAMRLFAGLIIAIVQGLVIAAAALALGDKGPRYDGRLRPAPMAHVDLGGLASLILTGFGWSKSVAIDAADMRLGRWGLVIAPLTGSVALLIAAWLVLLLVIPALTLLPHAAAIVVAAFLRTAAQLCVWMALFTLLPVPPLAGAHFLAAAGIRVPPATGVVVAWVLFVVSLLGITRTVLTPVYTVVASLILGPDFR